jgi:hypothetical protein
MALAVTSSQTFSHSNFFDILVDDCVNLIASKLSIADLLALSLVNSGLKSLLFSKFAVPPESHLTFDYYMLILTAQENLQVYDMSDSVIKPGVLRFITCLPTLYPKVMIVTREISVHDWNIAFKESNDYFLTLASSKNYFFVPNQKTMVTKSHLIKSHSFGGNIFVCDDIRFLNNLNKLKYKKFIYVTLTFLP